MVAPGNNWSNTAKFFNNRRRLTARVIKQNVPVPQQAILSRGRNNTRRFVTRLNAPKVNKVKLINGIKPSVATFSRSPSPSYARNVETINVSGHRVTPNTLKISKPLKAELFTVKGRPTLKRNHGRRNLTNVNNKKRNQPRNLLNNFVGVINE